MPFLTSIIFSDVPKLTKRTLKGKQLQIGKNICQGYTEHLQPKRNLKNPKFCHEVRALEH